MLSRVSKIDKHEIERNKIFEHLYIYQHGVELLLLM